MLKDHNFVHHRTIVWIELQINITNYFSLKLEQNLFHPLYVSMIVTKNNIYWSNQINNIRLEWCLG